MYPTVHSVAYDSATTSQQAQQQGPGGAGGQLGRVSYTRQPSLNGPASPTAAGAFPTLRVHIAEPYRTAPPVRAAVSALPPPPAQPPKPLVLDFERKILEDLAAAGPPGSSGAAEDRPDPYEVLLKRYTDMGYSREEAAMALAVAGEATDDADKVVEAAKQYKELRSMGFKADIVVGALVLNNGDLNAATDACLTANLDA